MVREGRRMGGRLCRLALLASGVAAAGMLAAPASALKLSVHTNRGGTCHLHSTASRSGGSIEYGIKVHDCSTRFGVRYVVSRGALYDRTAGVPVKNGFLSRKKGHLPYSNRRSVSGTTATHAYQTKIDLSIVLKTRRDRSTRHPEKWLDPGPRCHVKTTFHNGDTLGCELNDKLAAA